jgi:hypothetical protein
MHCPVRPSLVAINKTHKDRPEKRHENTNGHIKITKIPQHILRMPMMINALIPMDK